MNVEGEESAVLGDNRQVGLGGEIPHGGFHAHDVLGSVGFSGDDVHRADVDIRDGRREKDMHGFRKSRFDTLGTNFRRRFLCRLCRDFCRGGCCDNQEQINKVSFHFTAVLKSIIADGWL